MDTKANGGAALSRVRWLYCAVALLLGGCGTFQLSGGIYPPVGKSADQQQTDVLVCKDRAKLEANTAGRQAGAFALGLTVVGVPVAFELEKAKQREVFAECMTARGYRVMPAQDGANTQAASQRSSGSRDDIAKRMASEVEVRAAPAPAPVPAAAPAGDEASKLATLKSLRDQGLITEVEYRQKRQQIIDRL